MSLESINIVTQFESAPKESINVHVYALIKVQNGCAACDMCRSVESCH